ncbi:RNA-guided endonuclease TnpB family protein [Vreelandella massiliensis]|uniref:RNA-guided endonuclease TnpB family protein n=1 Tax=Vreelandella massiliensis TaxID=1816686 RepID=UPI00096A6134|nr:RNA-guided endonuclease TnpB family protein [Halomonas massiliensis]
MKTKMIRTDKWPLQATPHQQQLMRNTREEYRAFCRALSVVVLNNWPTLQQAPSFAAAVERLIHPTQKNPSPRHHYFAQRFYKFPSYLRRAAIEFVKGQVSSYLTRYREWQSGQRKRRDANPPRFNPVAGCYPVMYRGQLVKFDANFTTASLKLWDGKEWLWHNVSIKAVRKRHLLGAVKSPTLVLNRHCHLAVPVEITPERLPDQRRVCAVDVGINTLATASIVSSNGTVAARRFFHPAADIDRRDKRAAIIRGKARKSGKLSKGFGRQWYRKVQRINDNMAQQVSRQLVDFALAAGADVIVLEDLKGWRPKAGKKRSGLRQRFHQWLHRRLATLVEQKMREAGGRVVYVYARGTSSWAFDGSGRVTRDKKQYERATFPNGKHYNADLNASYNIGARYWAWKHKLTRRKDGQVSGGKRSPGSPRTPVITLSTLWRSDEAPNQCAA